MTSGWREATTPILDRFRRRAAPKSSSGIGGSSTAIGGFSGGGGGYGDDFGCPGGLSSLMNLSLLAGAGTGLRVANSSPSLARLLEVVKTGMAAGSGALASLEEEDTQSEEAEHGKMKLRPQVHQTESLELVYLEMQASLI